MHQNETKAQGVLALDSAREVEWVRIDIFIQWDAWDYDWILSIRILFRQAIRPNRFLRPISQSEFKSSYTRRKS